MTHQIIRTPHGVTPRGFYLRDPQGNDAGLFPSEQEAVREISERLVG